MNEKKGHFSFDLNSPYYYLAQNTSTTHNSYVCFFRGEQIQRSLSLVHVKNFHHIHPRLHGYLTTSKLVFAGNYMY